MSKTIAMWITVVALVVNAAATTVIAVKIQFPDPMTVIAKWEQMRQKMEYDMAPVKPDNTNLLDVLLLISTIH